MTTACDLPIDLSTKSQHHHHGRHHGLHHHHQHHLIPAHLLHQHHHHLQLQDGHDHHHHPHPNHHHHLHHLEQHHLDHHHQVQQLQLEYLSQQQLSAALANHPLHRLYGSPGTAAATAAGLYHQQQRHLDQLGRIEQLHLAAAAAAAAASTASSHHSQEGRLAASSSSPSPQSSASSSSGSCAASDSATSLRRPPSNLDRSSHHDHHHQLQLQQLAHHHQQLQLAAAHGHPHFAEHHLHLHDQQQHYLHLQHPHHLNHNHHHLSHLRDLSQLASSTNATLSSASLASSSISSSSSSASSVSSSSSSNEAASPDVQDGPLDATITNLHQHEDLKQQQKCEQLHHRHDNPGEDLDAEKDAQRELDQRQLHAHQQHQMQQLLTSHHHFQQHLQQQQQQQQQQQFHIKRAESPPARQLNQQLSLSGITQHTGHHHSPEHASQLGDNPSPIDLHRSSASSTVSTISSPSSSSASITSTSPSLNLQQLNDKKRINRPLTATATQTSLASKHEGGIGNSIRCDDEPSTEPSSRIQVIQLRESLDESLVEHQAKPVGLCPTRRSIYDQCFDELIRQVTVGCIEQGLLLFRIRNELRMTIGSYRRVYEAAVRYGLSKAIDGGLKLAKAERELEALTKLVGESSQVKPRGRKESSGDASVEGTSELAQEIELKLKEYYGRELAKKDEVIAQQRAMIKALNQKL